MAAMSTDQQQVEEVGFRRPREFRDVVIPPEWNAKTERIIGLAMEVHSHLGPGLLERIYEDAMELELTRAGFRVNRQFVFRPKYKGLELSPQRLDCVIDELIVMEFKATESVPDVHLAQLLSYMRLAGFPLGLLINFNVVRLRDGIHRKLNAAACPPRKTGSLPSEPSGSPMA
jgi:GxxExxY protein